MENLRKQKSIDSFCGRTGKDRYFDWPMARFVQKYKQNSLLFSKYGKTDNFSTDNLKLHFIKNSRQPNFSSLDGFLNFEKRISVAYAAKNRDLIYQTIKQEYGNLQNYLKNVFQKPFGEISMVKMWNVSIVGALIFGMFIMTFIYRYLGQGASAVSLAGNQRVLGEETAKSQDEDSGEMENYVTEIMKEYQNEKDSDQKMEEEIKEMVKGYPIEKMVPYIAEKDSVVAAFLVGIAKKESDWGKHVPVLDGEDCFNYWGYRGIRKRMGTGGHTCFDSPKDAVDTVAKRLEFLVSNEKMTTPGKMVTVWKCGYDCSWDNPEAVRKWVSDVDRYFKKFD